MKEFERAIQKKVQEKNPNQGHSDPNVKDSTDFPENEIVNDEREISSDSRDNEPI